MNLFATPAEIDEALAGSQAARRDGALAVTNAARFRSEVVDGLVQTAVFGPPPARDAARRDIREAAASLGILPASILPLYGLAALITPSEIGLPPSGISHSWWL